jgi:diadenosine tetraphosphate (Ap4A) HIT family hydrolase
MNACPFCSILPADILDENEYAVAVRDSFPASRGHTLIITKRHVEDYFQLSKEEKDKAFELLEKMKKAMDTEFAPDGYNIGFNIGEAGGQTILHVHIHLIPRKKGDSENCKGGIKGVIRRQMSY